MTAAIEFVEVGPRDGLQNEQHIVSTAEKISLIERAVAAGVRRIEVASFVHPARVPQMADAEAVIAGLALPADVTTIGLVLNKKGALRALATKVDELGAVCVASDGFGQKNQGQSSAESVVTATEIVRLAKAQGRSAQVTISTAFGCPFDGRVAPEQVVAIARELAAAGPRELALADTIGVAAPNAVSRLVAEVRQAIYPIPVRAHFHNTRNTGLANVWAAVTAGASVIDGSIGGLGGCPFAPGASGNVGSEDVAYLLRECGVATGLDLAELIRTAHWLSEVMGKPLPAMLSRAGDFPAAPLAIGQPG